MLSILPTEILLDIIQTLPVTTVASLSALSKSWATFIAANETSIYHNASKRHGYVSGEDLETGPTEGWKTWFIRKFQIELRWIGKLPGNFQRIKVPGKTGFFHRIKVDEEAGFVINTFSNGGLVVSDIHDHRMLWSLDEDSCVQFVHCEYDEGFIVFNRIDNYKEVWRRRTDVLDVPEEAWPSGEHNRPDRIMIRANRIAEAKYFDPSHSRDPDHLRGQFVPWARLLVPENGRAFKLSWKTLLVASPRKAFLFDVEKGELLQTIDVDDVPPGVLRYVDLSQYHVFVVSTLRFSVYDRATGSCILSILAGTQPWDFYANPDNQWRRTGGTPNGGELHLSLVPPNGGNREDYFHAAHVSSCGKDLAIMTASSRVILVQDFWRLFPTMSSSNPPTQIPSPITLKDISKQIDFYAERPVTESGGYLAYGHGRVAVVGVDGLYVLVLDSILDQFEEIGLPRKHVSLQNMRPPPEHESSWPKLRLHEVKFYDREMLSEALFLCLQLTETKLYFSALLDDTTDDFDEGGNMWCYDFASSPKSTTKAIPEVEDWNEEHWEEEHSDEEQDGDEWDDLEARIVGDRKWSRRR